MIVYGKGSRIAEELAAMAPPGEDDRYVFCQGYLAGRSATDHDVQTAGETWRVNFVNVAQACDAIFAENSMARVVVVGSESGFSGSYDPAYAGAKAALHLYVETKELGPNQQLVAVAPGIIGDAGMTTRRPDQRDLNRRALQHPKGRFVTSVEVARLIRFLLYDDQGFITGTVIRMHGGRAA